MSELSKQYHSIIIDDKNTWDDWHLVPETRPVVNPPEVDEQYVEIPGANGALDYTEALTGAPVYKNRTGSWTFIVMNGYQEWHDLFNRLLSYLHGRTFSIILEDDPEYKYTGRLKLNEWKSEEHNSKIVIDYNLEPFKEIANDNIPDWRWDDLTFDSDAYIIYLGSFYVYGERNRVIYNPSEKEVDLHVFSTAPMKMYIGHDMGTVYNIFSGTNDTLEIKLSPKTEHVLQFIGTGTIILNYDRGNVI